LCPCSIGRFLYPHNVEEPELLFPLEVVFCEDCSLVQILETVSPELLYADNYPYYSSFSPAFLAHAKENVLQRLAEKPLDSSSLVIELASNDGYLLKNYVDHGVPVLGIDPAEGPVAEAEKIGVRSMCAFFTEELAPQVVAEYGAADIVHGCNVLAHVKDTNGFVAGIRKMLKPDGLVVIEAPYLLPMIAHTEFDTIYHEHHCYFSLLALDKLFRRHGLYINRVEEVAVHGGTIRIFAEPTENVGESVLTMLANERSLGMDGADFYREFSQQVDHLREKLLAMVGELKAQGKTVAAYGAAAKGAILLNSSGITRDTVDFVADRSTMKQGLFMPGSKIPVLPPEAMLEKKPDYVIILAWNFAEEIIQQQAEYLAAGGKFIVPVPEPVIL
jgi:SAM-dependent methyltransferase